MSKKLPEIERTPGGGLPRMTPAQRRQANALIRKTCCKWFRWAVLPQDKALEAEIFRSASVKRCAECGAAFVPKSNRAKYCPECATRATRQGRWKPSRAYGKLQDLQTILQEQKDLLQSQRKAACV